jgi:TorA maturation chaperone TorD
MSTATLDEALAVARRLPPRDRARLIAQLAEELATAPPTSPAIDAWDTLFAVMDEIAATPYTSTHTATEEITTSRR